MGSEATLDVGLVQLDYSKNFLNDHSALFRVGDVGTAEYRYVDDDDNRVVENREAYTSSLRGVVPRLELLGVTIESIRGWYARQSTPIPFEVFQEVFRLADLRAEPERRSFENDPDQSISEVGSALIAGIGVERADKYDDSLWELLDTIDPRASLRLLAENPENLELTVAWRFADVVDGGWVARDAVHRPLATREQFLVVTEGSTDANVLQKALALRRPKVCDFFYFVDMSENYPFSGTGNLFNFSKGLARIRIENRVIVLYDNDAEGKSKHQASEALTVPGNIRAMTLPSLPAFRQFATIGPTGETIADINGTAASIECYLDLAFGMPRSPVVRWTNFQASSGTYQGSLVDKDRYTRAFLGLRPGDEDGYDFRKLDSVLDALIGVAVSIASDENVGG